MKRLTLPVALVLGATSAVSAQSMTVKHDDGTTQLKMTQAGPQRVVVLDTEMLGWLYALGVSNRVIGLGGPSILPTDLTSDGTLKPERAKVGFLGRGDLNPSVRFVGTWTAPNLETIAALKPDLILRSTWPGNQNFANLNKIAPTIGYAEATPGYWREDFRTVAKIFGKQTLAEQAIKAVADTNRVNGRKLLAAGVLSRYPKVVVVTPFPNNKYYVYTAVRLIDDLKVMGFRDALAAPEKGTPAIGFWASEEALLNLDKKTLVIPLTTRGLKDALDTFTASPVGQRLKDQTVPYIMEEYSPWAGPLVFPKVSNDITHLILDKVK